MIDGREIIDFHGHVGRWDIFEMSDDADEILHAMDAVGIDRSQLLFYSIFFIQMARRATIRLRLL